MFCTLQMASISGGVGGQPEGGGGGGGGKLGWEPPAPVGKVIIVNMENLDCHGQLEHGRQCSR